MIAGAVDVSNYWTGRGKSQYLSVLKEVFNDAVAQIELMTGVVPPITQ